MRDDEDLRFACDAMLGGLARWLRAAGYDAFWQEGIDDGELVRRAHAEGMYLLTSDNGIFLRVAVRDGIVPSLFVPLLLSPEEQLGHVLEALHLPLREPRCMACGGKPLSVSKELVRDRVPPRTFAWLEEFWECDRCRKVFWHGTHWQRIVERLPQIIAASDKAPKP
jgi:uncharacterized protein with PIN domain